MSVTINNDQFDATIIEEAVEVTMVDEPILVSVEEDEIAVTLVSGKEGPAGPAGAPGAGLDVLGSLNDEADLPLPAEVGDAYIIGLNLWVYDGVDWLNMGPFVGPKGETGPQGDKGDKGEGD